MELNNINNKGNWGSTADSLNDNFAKVNTEVEKVKNLTVKFKGFFNSFDGLASVYPKPGVGDTAWAGEVYPGIVYNCTTAGIWVNTGKAPITETVELADYATKDEVTKLDKFPWDDDYPMSQTLARKGVNKFLINASMSPL